MPTYYIADEAADFADGVAIKVQAPNPERAAMDRAEHLFDTGDFDLLRPLPIIVASDPHGSDAVKYTIARIEEVRYEINGSKSVKVQHREDD